MGEGRANKMIRTISKIIDLPPEVLENYRRIGWTDEETVENLNEAIDFLNSHLWCDNLDEDIPLNAIFS
jgi:hypothetical protein